jgi:hypothetical protein
MDDLAAMSQPNDDRQIEGGLYEGDVNLGEPLSGLSRRLFLVDGENRSTKALWPSLPSIQPILTSP